MGEASSQRKRGSNAASRSRSSARRRSHRGPTSRGRPQAHDPPRPSSRGRATRGGHSNSDPAIRVDSATWSRTRWAFRRMNRRVSHLIAGWRTGRTSLRAPAGPGGIPGQRVFPRLSPHLSWAAHVYRRERPDPSNHDRWAASLHGRRRAGKGVTGDLYDPSHHHSRCGLHARIVHGANQRSANHAAGALARDASLDRAGVLVRIISRRTVTTPRRAPEPTRCSSSTRAPTHSGASRSAVDGWAAVTGRTSRTRSRA